MTRLGPLSRRRIEAWSGRLLAAVACAAAAAETPQPLKADGRPGVAAVLDLPGDGFLTGGLVPVAAAAARPRGTLLWRSPLFTEPIEFAVDEIERIRFPRSEIPWPAATAWRVWLRGGGFASGAIEAIDPEHLVLAVPGVADKPLRIRRAAIERISRDAAGRVIVPGGLAGWDAARADWHERAGRLVCGTAGAGAFRDTAAAPRACFELVLSWEERPDVEVFFATDAGRPRAVVQNKTAAAGEQYRVEMTAGDLLAIREGTTAGKFDVVGSIPPGAGGLSLQVFVDQSAGRMAVVLPAEAGDPTTVFDETLAPHAPGKCSGFGIRLRGGSVRVDGLRVVPWTDPEPRLADSGIPGGAGAVLEAFDKAQDTFTFRAADGPRTVAAATVGTIEFPSAEAAGVGPRAGMVMAAFHGGARVSGWIGKIAERAVHLDSPAIADPLVCEFGQLAELESLARRPAGPLPGRSGRLEADAGRMLGCLANAAGTAGGIAWRPLAAVAAVPLVATVPLRISYRDVAAAGGGTRPEREDPAAPATVYLKTGDAMPCTVVSADPEGLRIRTDRNGETVVPAVAVRAVELSAATGMGIPRAKLARLLTLPRMQQADPPTHMLRLPDGDYLRGKLVALDEKAVRMDVLGTLKTLPRSEATRLIWLSVEGDEAEAKAIAAALGAAKQGGVPMRVTMTTGRRLSLAAERVDGDQLVGTNGLLGNVGVDLARCDQLDVGTAASETPPGDVPFSQWRLKPAAAPRSVRKPPAATDAADAAASLVGDPVAGRATLLQLLRLLEPDTAGRRHLSAIALEGRIVVLGLVDVADRAGLDRLPGLAAAVAAFEADAVTCAAIVARGSPAEVARAVAGLQAKPPIALDPAERWRAICGEPALPACVLVDRESRIAAVLPLADGGIGRIRAGIARLVADSRETHGEFQALERAHERALAGDRGCLDDLGELLAARALTVRTRACSRLRRLTGLWENDMPFRAGDPPAVRAEHVRAWRQWLAKEGPSASLAFPTPVDAEWADERPIMGRTLVCRPQRHDAVELDEAGKEVLTVAAVLGWACDVTPEGTRLIGDHAAKAVVEYDANGREVWAVRDLPGGPMSARRLDNGNTLVALSDADLVAEYDPQGKVVWSVRVEGRPCDARRLPDGGTLVAAHKAGRIVEFDAAGNETWDVRDIDDPQAAQRLPNGNTLVAMSKPGIVREIDRDGRVVWRKEGLKVPLDVQRLPDGRTLVQEQQGDLVELGPDGAEISRTKTGGSRFLRF